jgi:hypothetical protein
MDEDGHALSPEVVIANIDAWLPHNQADPWYDVYRRQRDWAARCIREGREFRVVPESVAVSESLPTTAASSLRGSAPLPTDEILRRIDEWEQVWGKDAPQHEKDRVAQILASIHKPAAALSHTA